MKKLMIICITLLPFAVNAQTKTAVGVGSSTANPDANDFFVDNLGRRVPIKSNYEYFGSPYFGEKYCSATLEVKGGKRYENVQAKVDLLENSVLYIDKDGSELVSIVPITSISFHDCSDPSKNRVLVSGLPPIDKQDGSSFYVVLDSGNVSLLKHAHVSFYDKQNNYGAATMARYFNQSYSYYLYSKSSQNRLTKIGKENAEVLSLFEKNKDKLAVFADKNNIKVRKEEDLIKLVKYYNSLP